MSGDERAEAHAADLLALRAHQLAVHGLSQREHGDAAVAAIFNDADTDDAALELCCATLGVLWRAIPGDVAQVLAADLRGRIPGLMLRAEGGSP